ncbi:unknown [Crocosphaera subtropica ATCC 51142]|uniref:Uncharacterized protein n=1 Tax=Crocosphaera subtropica (strain ATCC 51142 / BH68) TaxID=43989 RepID=B1X1U5_CROS5|nr:hypothetical protein [Crocosphaera subtropica]ACB53125.1 unknown [Crocosphaera subtropica ATCC 51142]
MKIKTQGLKLSTLSSMSPQEREDKINSFIEQVINPQPEQVEEQKKEIEEEIRAYERRYEISSAKLKSGLADGSIKGTTDICSWLMLLKKRTLLENI